MSTIPIQQLVLDTDTDIGLTSDLINGTYKTSSMTDLSNNLYTKISDLSSNVYTQLSNKQPTLNPLTSLVGIGNNITTLDYNNITLNKPNLTVYAIKSNVDSSLNTINTTLTNKQNLITVSTPLIKDVSNNLSIDLSGYTLLSSFNALSTTVSTKENALTFSTPLTRTTNTIGIDLSAYDTIALRNTALGSYLLSSTASSTYATITNLNTKQNTLTFSSPLINTSNTITIDLSAYDTIALRNAALGSYLLSSTASSTYATISNLNTKQNNLTFSNPILNTSNTISLKLNSAQFNIDASGNLSLVSGISSKWTASGSDIYYNTGNIGIGTATPKSLLHIKGTSPALTIMGAGGTGATTQLNLSTYDHTTNAPNCSLIATDTGSFGATFQIKQKISGADTNAQFTSFFIDGAGNVNIGTTGQAYRLYVNGTSYFNDILTTSGNMYAGGLRINGNDTGNTIYQGSTTTGANIGFTLRDNNTFNFYSYSSAFVYTNLMNISMNGISLNKNVNINGDLTLKADTWNKTSDGKNRIYFQPNGRTYLQGYGTPTASDNAFEFLNSSSNLILGINDNGNTFFLNQISCKLYVAPANPHDFIGIAYDSATSGNYTLYIIQYSFTGFHRSIINDELFNIYESQKFKDDYVGRIVIATGKIATDINNGVDNWELQYDKDGLFIEDAHPIIKLCRTKKDKRVFGVLGDPKRTSSRIERLIVNSIGEGCMWVCNSNGNIENGDYIQSSDYLGYGEKQDDDLLHNYTVAKATINCNFELDSTYYNCLEIENGLRVAFISVTYHCG